MKKLLLILFFLILADVLSAQNNPDTIRIAVTNIPPFITGNGNKHEGISIELWKLIDDTLKMPYKIIQFKDFSKVLLAVKTGEADMSVVPFTVTSSRLSMFRMSIPFFNSNLGILTRSQPVSFIDVIFEKIFSLSFLKWLTPFFFLTVVFAVLMWLTERRRNTRMFHSGWRGIGDGLWWAFVTMTTVGYGDKCPKTKTGRMLSVIWMFVAIAMFFVITGFISSEMTYSKLQGNIQSVQELRKAKVGTIYKSGYAEMLDNISVNYTNFFDIREAIDAVAEEKIDALIYDETILDYYLSKYPRQKDIMVVPSQLNQQYFCFLYNKERTGLAEKVNPVLLKCIESEKWQQIINKWEIESDR